MNRFGLIVEFEIKPENIGKFMELINENARLSVKDEPGCLQFDVLQAKDNPNKVVLYEIYENDAAFDAHVKMPHVGKFFGAAKEMIAKQTAHRLKRVSPNEK